VGTDEIVAVAADVFAELGYAGTTLDRIAARFGITRQGVLHYFGSKQELFEAVLEHDRQWAARSALTPADPERHPLGSLRGYLGSSAEGRRRLRLSHVLEGEALIGNAVAQRFVADRSTVVRGHVRARVAETASRTGLRPGWTEETATDAVLAVVEGLQTAVLRGDGIDALDVFDRFVQTIAAGTPATEGASDAD
jgi:AcrR family transcriptional regulator